MCETWVKIFSATLQSTTHSICTLLAASVLLRVRASPTLLHRRAKRQDGSKFQAMRVPSQQSIKNL
jgi:hypothetical protein